MFGADPAPHDPPGAGASKCAPGESQHKLKARGGPGGTARGTLGAHCESEHAHHTTRAHNEPFARYNWAARGARRDAGRQPRQTTQARRAARPPADLRAETTNVCGSGGTLVSPRRANKALLRGCRLSWRGGRRVRESQKQKPGATQAQPTHATPGDAREKRPTRLGLYHDLRGAHTILDTLATLRIF